MDEQNTQTKTVSASKTKMAIAVGFLGLAAIAAGFAGFRFRSQQPDLIYAGSSETPASTYDATYNRFGYTFTNLGPGISATPVRLNIQLGEGSDLVTQIYWIESDESDPTSPSVYQQPMGNVQMMNSDTGSFNIPISDNVLNVGETKTVYYWFVLPADYSSDKLAVRYHIDVDNYLAETKENNNIKNSLFDIAGMGLAFEGPAPEEYWCLDLKENCYESSPGDTSCDGRLFPSEANCIDAGNNYDWQPKKGEKGTYYELTATNPNGLSCTVDNDCGVGGGCGPCVSGQQECTFSTGACMESGSCEVLTELRVCASEPVVTTTQEYWCLDHKENCVESTPGGVHPVTGEFNCEGGMLYQSEQACSEASVKYDWEPIETVKGTQYQLVTSTTAIFCQTDNDCGVGGGCSECVNRQQSCTASTGKCLSNGVCEVKKTTQACSGLVQPRR